MSHRVSMSVVGDNLILVRRLDLDLITLGNELQIYDGVDCDRC